MIDWGPIGGKSSELKRVGDCSRHWLAARRVAPVVLFLLAIALVVAPSPSALAFDCLTSKPEGARGHWHTQAVAGKICWFGADWRSFLAKSKAQAEPTEAQAEPSPVAKTEPKPEPQPATDVTPSPAETTDAEQPQDPPGLRQATPVEAAALINSISLDFEPAPSAAPQPAQIPPKAAPEAYAQSRNTGDWLITFGELAIIGGVLATLIRYFRRRRAMKAQQPQPGFAPVSLRFAPPLQPGISADVQSPSRVPWATVMRSPQTDPVN